jgi:uncharacterized membrane protein YraQ (UPF0718 family)
MKFSTDTSTTQITSLLVGLLLLLIVAIGLAITTYFQMAQNATLEIDKAHLAKSLATATTQLEPLLKERDLLKKQVEVLTKSSNEIQETAQALALQLGKNPTVKTITKH